MLFLVGRALTYGRRTAVSSLLGHSAGTYVVAVAVAFGLGSVVQRSEPVFLAVKVAGAAYLVWLGVQAIRGRGELAGHVPEQMLLLACVTVVIGLLSDTAWVLSASAFRTWFARSPRRLSVVGGAGGLIMVGLGVNLALAQRTD